MLRSRPTSAARPTSASTREILGLCSGSRSASHVPLRLPDPTSKGRPQSAKGPDFLGTGTDLLCRPSTCAPGMSSSQSSPQLIDNSARLLATSFDSDWNLVKKDFGKMRMAGDPIARAIAKKNRGKPSNRHRDEAVQGLPEVHPCGPSNS